MMFWVILIGGHFECFALSNQDFPVIRGVNNKFNSMWVVNLLPFAYYHFKSYQITLETNRILLGK